MTYVYFTRHGVSYKMLASLEGCHEPIEIDASEMPTQVGTSTRPVMPDHDELCPFPHRGVEYLADGNERIWTQEGELLGYICGRGQDLAWSANDSQGNEIDWGHVRWDADEEDPAMDAILQARKKHEEASK